VSFRLTDAEVQALGDGDLVLRDHFLGATTAAALVAECAALAARARPAGVGRDHRLDAAIRSDDILWVDDDALPTFRATVATVAAELARAAYLGVRTTELQLAIYRTPGAAYARHADAFRGQASRRATLIYYLNAGWQPDHGGQLRAHTPAGSRDVDPLLDRAVLFLSDRLDHEVLPSHAPRMALTAWLR
jgi:SM-20-related protein